MHTVYHINTSCGVCTVSRQTNCIHRISRNKLCGATQVGCFITRMNRCILYNTGRRQQMSQKEMENLSRGGGGFVQKHTTPLCTLPPLSFPPFHTKLHMPRPIVHPKVTHTNRAGRGGSLNLSTEGGVFVVERGRCRDNTSCSAPATHQFGKRRWRVMLTKSLVITTKHDYAAFSLPHNAHFSTQKLAVFGICLANFHIPTEKSYPLQRAHSKLLPATLTAVECCRQCE